MTLHAGKRQRAGGGRPVTWRLAAGGLAAVVAALVIPSLPAAGAAVVASGGGADHLAAASGVTLRAWGLNDAGQLGDGTTSTRDVPVTVKLPPGVTITSVRAGCHHTLALTSTGQVLAWGSNNSGQLGDGTTTDSSVPVPVTLPSGTKVTAVRAGCAHSLALTSTGKVLAWGNNGFGQLGDGTTAGIRDVPVMVSLPVGTTVTAVSAGDLHSLALTSKGTVLAWGDNNSGQLGDGATGGISGPVPVALPAGAKVTAVAAGRDHSLALTSTGQVLAWGANDFGELGNGTTTGSDTPVRVRLAQGTKVTGLFAGCFDTLALTATRQVLAWGDNRDGELGNGRTGGMSATPARVRLAKGTKVTAISAGCGYGLARTASGRVLAWGANPVGELGNGGAVGSSIPVGVDLPAGLSAIAIGSGSDANHSLAIVRKAKP